MYTNFIYTHTLLLRNSSFSFLLAKVVICMVVLIVYCMREVGTACELIAIQF